MTRVLEQEVRNRAAGLCEYCHAPQALYRERFQIDHITAKQHGGKTESRNLALCCLECNRRKGPNLSGIDPESKQTLRLFHPREDNWIEHFFWNGAILLGRTPIGRATISVLDINRAPRVVVRRTLIEEGVFPTV
jgi:HNH endonuclease